MNEEIEYAEMLEIPVSTVSVVRKKRKKRKQSAQKQDTTDMRQSLIAQVNDRLEAENADQITAEAELFAEGANSEGSLDFGEFPDRVDTVRLYSANDRFFAENDNILSSGENVLEDRETQNRAGRYENDPPATGKWTRIVLGAEFAVACALCGAIFLTNVLMPNSAINTFFRSLGSAPAQTATDTRTYTDFTLSPVVSELSDTELSLSPAGVLSFSGACLVYPASDGKVSEILQNADGDYTLKVSYSDTFTGVFDGLEKVYYEVGEEVKANVPVGYLGAESEAQVTMYSQGELLSCFTLTEENCLAWVAQE